MQGSGFINRLFRMSRNDFAQKYPGLALWRLGRITRGSHSNSDEFRRDVKRLVEDQGRVKARAFLAYYYHTAENLVDVLIA